MVARLRIKVLVVQALMCTPSSASALSATAVLPPSIRLHARAYVNQSNGRHVRCHQLYADSLLLLIPVDSPSLSQSRPAAVHRISSRSRRVPPRMDPTSASRTQKYTWTLYRMRTGRMPGDTWYGHRADILIVHLLTIGPDRRVPRRNEQEIRAAVHRVLPR